jgi:hypothetical protein
MKMLLLSFFLLVASSCFAQTGAPEKFSPAPTYIVAPADRRVPSVKYAHSSPIHVDFAGTWLLPKAHGEATISTGVGGLNIEVKVKDLRPASELGPAYLTYVLWGLTVDGKVRNLGEITLTGSTGSLMAATDLDDFAMFISAEPYFAVTQPSDAVILKNAMPEGALRYKLAPDLLPLLRDRQTPLELVEARNAVRIARRLGAERLASTALETAASLLSQAEQKYRDNDLMQTVSKAREAIQAAETARVIAANTEPR